MMLLFLRHSSPVRLLMLEIAIYANLSDNMENRSFSLIPHYSPVHKRDDIVKFPPFNNTGFMSIMEHMSIMGLTK